MGKITSIHSIQILDSRGNPTVEATVELENGAIGRASVPSGASTGSREAVELRDGDQDKYLGKGVQEAVKNINTEIQSALLGQSIEDQKRIDQLMIELDGTEISRDLGLMQSWLSLSLQHMLQLPIIKTNCSNILQMGIILFPCQ